jgi:hypothetical protein
MLADPTYLIGTDGRVSFYNYWTHVPTLHRAIDALLARGGAGALGSHRMVHPLATLTNGWPGLRRGLPQSFWDLETAAPGTASGPWLGYQCRSLLAPFALAAEPWPASTRWGLTLAAAGLLFAATAKGTRARSRTELPQRAR